MKPTDQDLGRDPELDSLLAPLRGPTPNQNMLNSWENLGPSQNRPRASYPLTRKIIEWSIAAAVGFTAATIVFRNSNSGNDDSQKYFSDVDATEMHLVAK